MSRGTAKSLEIVSAVVFVLLMILFAKTGNVVGAIIAVAVYVPIGRYLRYCRRCKHCGRWPRKGGFFDEFCPNCGKKME